MKEQSVPILKLKYGQEQRPLQTMHGEAATFTQRVKEMASAASRNSTNKKGRGTQKSNQGASKVADGGGHGGA